MAIKQTSSKIVAFTGLPGAGKSSAVNYLTKQGIPKVYVGGFIIDGLKSQGIEVNSKNERIYREQMREEHGKEYFIRLCSEQIHRLIEAGQRYVVLDGLYSWSEYKFLKKEFPGELINVAIVAPKHVRHHRLSQRPVRSLTGAEATARDWAEIENLEKGGPIAVADFFIINDSSVENLNNKIDDIVQITHFCKAPIQC